MVKAHWKQTESLRDLDQSTVLPLQPMSDAWAVGRPWGGCSWTWSFQELHWPNPANPYPAADDWYLLACGGWKEVGRCHL